MRIINLQNLLKEKDLPALLVTNPYNSRYISNFTGTAGICLVLQDNAYLLTDFRYVQQAHDEVENLEIIEHERPVEKTILSLLKKHNVSTLGFEKTNVTYKHFEQLEQNLEDIELIGTEELIESLRLIKSGDELKILQDAARIADDAFIHIQDFMKPGVREVDVALELEYFMRKAGATSSSFDIIVASGERSALPHGVASEKKIALGELVTLDFGAYYKGYCSDITRTVSIGKVSDKLREIYDVVLEAQRLGVAGTKAGMLASQADALTRDYIKDCGYGAYFGHSTGHGLGMEVHEGPGLSPNSQEVLQTGMVVTIEPGIYVPGVGGCRIEDDVVITEEGNIRLTQASKQFIELT